MGSEKCARSGNIEKVKSERLNSNSFEFNSKGLSKDQELEVSKNVGIFGGAPEDDERINGKVGDQELKPQRHQDIL